MPRIDVLDKTSQKEKKRSVLFFLTRACNLKCKYCYEPRNKENEVMKLETIKKNILYYMDLDEFEGVEFQFFGGEPLLEFPLIKKTIEWFHSKQWRKKHIFFICTNGTLLSPEIKNWLQSKKEWVVVGTSLDGNRIAHNLGRSNSYDAVMKNMPFITKNWPKQPVKMTIYAETIPYVADSIIEMENMGLIFTANMIFEDIWGSSEQKSNLLGVYAEQLGKLVDFYSENPLIYPVNLVDKKIEFLFDSHKQPNQEDDNIRFCGAGHEMVAIEPNGEVIPCQRFSKWITKKVPPTKKINDQKKWKPDKCVRCKLVPICPTCAGLNWQINHDTSIRTTFHCDAFKLEVLASAKLQAKKLEKKFEELSSLSQEEIYVIGRKIDSIIELNKNIE